MLTCAMRYSTLYYKIATVRGVRIAEKRRMASLAFVFGLAFCVTQVLDSRQLAQGQGAHTDSEPYVFTEEDLDAGLHLSWQRLGNTTQSLNLTGVHLPEDLKQSYEFYNTVTVRHNGLYMYRSVNGGVLVVHFDSDLAYLSHQVITWPDTGRLPCQPTTVFRGATDFFLFTACLNRTEDRVWFVLVQIDSSNITTWTLDPTTDAHKSVSFENLTAFIRSDKAYSCPGLDSQHYVLFISGRVVYAYLSFAKVVEARGHLGENCSEPVRLEFLETEKSGTVLVHCKGHYSEVINSCNDLFVAGYEDTLVPCSSELTVYFNSSGVLVSRPYDNLTSFIAVDIGPESTRDSVCITADHSTFLMLVLANSTIVLVDVVSQEVYRLGTSCTDRDWCPIPQVSRNRYLVYPNGTHLLVTDINCLSQPVLVNNGIPEVFYLYSPSQVLPPIPKCNEVSSTSVVFPSTSVPIPSTSVPIPSTSIPIPTNTVAPNETIPRKDDGSTDNDNIAIVVGTTVPAAVSILAIVIVAIVVCYKIRKRRRSKEQVRKRRSKELPIQEVSYDAGKESVRIPKEAGNGNPANGNQSTVPASDTSVTPDPRDPSECNDPSSPPAVEVHSPPPGPPANGTLSDGYHNPSFTVSPSPPRQIAATDPTASAHDDGSSSLDHLPPPSPPDPPPDASTPAAQPQEGPPDPPPYVSAPAAPQEGNPSSLVTGGSMHGNQTYSSQPNGYTCIGAETTTTEDEVRLKPLPATPPPPGDSSEGHSYSSPTSICSSPAPRLREHNFYLSLSEHPELSSTSSEPQSSGSSNGIFGPPAEEERTAEKNRSASIVASAAANPHVMPSATANDGTLPRPMEETNLKHSDSSILTGGHRLAMSPLISRNTVTDRNRRENEDKNDPQYNDRENYREQVAKRAAEKD